MKGALAPLTFDKHFPHGSVQVGERQLDAIRLYHVLRDALGHSIWHQTTPQSSKFIQDSQNRFLQASFQAIDDRLAEIFCKPKRGTPLSSEQTALHRIDWALAKVELSRVAADLCRKFEDTNVYGPDDKQLSGIKLDEIFVPGSFLPWAPHNTVGTGNIGSDGRTISFSTLLKSAFRTVVVGDPGGGKTTAAQMMALSLARTCQRDDTYLPLVVTIRRYEAALAADANLNLLDFISRATCSDIMYSDEERFRDLIIFCLSIGKVFIFFDGLDEIVNVGHRKAFTNKVALFAKQYPLCPILVTSRRVGYEKAPLPTSFQHYALSEMTLDQSFTYFSQLSHVVFDVPHNKADQDAADFMGKTGRDSPDIVGNPLMMALMVWLYHSKGGEMPNTRARLYHECANLMFERWDRQRNISATLPEGFDLFPLLNELASEIYNDASLGAGVSRTWLLERVRHHFLKYYDSNKDMRARRDAGQVLDFITGRAWIMTDAGADRYAFTHRTFLEYFFSQSLNDEAETVADLFALIRPNIEKGVWTVPAHLALQSKIQGRSRSALDVSDHLLELSSNLATSKRKTQIVQFMSGVFEYLSTIPEAKLTELTRRFTKAAMNEPDWFHLMLNLLRTSNRRRGIIYKAVAQLTSEEFSSTSRYSELASGSRYIDRMADLCKRLYVAYRYSSTTLERARLFYAAEFLTNMRDALNTVRQPSGTLSATSAKLWYDLTGDPSPDDATHGYAMWEQSVSYLKRGDWFIADAELMLSRLAECNPQSDTLVHFSIRMSRQLLKSAPYVPPASNAAYMADLVSTDFPFSRACSSPDHDIALAGVVIAVAYLQYCQSYDAALHPSATIFSDMREAYFSIEGRPDDDARSVTDLLGSKSFLFMRRSTPGGQIPALHPERFFEI